MTTATLIILAIVVVTALAFDFTNGFHDTGNAMATSIATGALKPLHRSGPVCISEPCRRLPLCARRSNRRFRHRQPRFLRPHEPQRRHANGRRSLADRGLHRSHRRHPVEPLHLAPRPAIQLFPRSVWRPHRRRPRSHGNLWRGMVLHRGQDPHSCLGVPIPRSLRLGLRYRIDLLGDQHDSVQGEKTSTSATVRSSPRPSCPWRTVPAMHRKPWA